MLEKIPQQIEIKDKFKERYKDLLRKKYDLFMKY